VSTAPGDRTATSGGAAIRIAALRKSFRTRSGPVPVLDGIDLEVREHEFVAIVGPSGCGKTTLLHCVAGFEPIDSGSIEIDGEPVRGPSPKRVFVFQEPGIFPWLDVRENIGFGLSRHLQRTARAAIVNRYVELVGLQGFEGALPSQLSGGMKQRVEFARALAVEPDVLYLDEPFGSLDALTRLEMRREIVALWKSTGKTCLLVTHDVEEACELADLVAVLGPRPARVQAVVTVPLPRPRDPDSEDFRRIKEHLWDMLGVERRV
jgi:ABC-type nitrate/sulfonate/bicarbonate transport system ATPase subunit